MALVVGNERQIVDQCYAGYLEVRFPNGGSGLPERSLEFATFLSGSFIEGQNFNAFQQ